MFRQLAQPHDSFPWFWPPPHMHTRSSGRGSTTEPSYYYQSNQENAFVEIELPGVAKPDINIEVNGHHLTISGKRYRKLFSKKDGDIEVEEVGGTGGDGEDVNGSGKKTPDMKDETVIDYLLDLRLGHDADIDNVKVEKCADGVLVLNIPVVQQNIPRKIKV